MFWQNNGNMQISDVKTAIVLMEYSINQNKINQIFSTINPLINRY